MGLKNKTLIGLMALCLVGGVSSALATVVTRAPAGASGTGGFDEAIYFYWDTDTSNKTLDACDSLQTAVPVYRYLTVSPKTTKSVAGYVLLDFTLAVSNASSHLSGLTVTVYQTNELANDGTVETRMADDEHPLALDSSHLTGRKYFQVSASNNSQSHETQTFYAIKVVYDGTFVQDKVLSGSLSIAQSFTTVDPGA